MKSRLPRKDSKGFTLIEMLVALVIMGLLAGLISGAIRSDERGVLRMEAERLAQLLGLAAAQSRMSGKPVAWVSDGAGYQFLRYQTGAGWSEIADDALLRKRTLPQGIAIAGVRVEASRSQESMRLEFRPRGLPPLYDISMSSGAGGRYTVSGSPVGDVEALPGGKKANAEILSQ
jgi:general secretion pathway protein H